MKSILLSAAAAALLSACSGYPLEQDTLACDRMTDWSQRQVCKEKAGAAERDWDRQQREKAKAKG